MCGTDTHGRARGVGAAPRRRRSSEAIQLRILVPRIAYLGRDKKKLLTKSLKLKNDFIYIYVFLWFPLYCSTICMVDGCGWMVWSGLLVLVVKCVSKFSLPGGGHIIANTPEYYFILLFTIVAGFGIHREYEDSSSDQIDTMDHIVEYARAGKKLLFGLRLASCCDLNVERRILNCTRLYIPGSI